MGLGAEAFAQLLDIEVERPDKCAKEPSLSSDAIMRGLEDRVTFVPVKNVKPFPEVNTLIRRILFQEDKKGRLADLPDFAAHHALCERYWERIDGSLEDVARIHARLGTGVSEYMFVRCLFTCFLAPYLCLEREDGSPFGELRGGYVLSLLAYLWSPPRVCPVFLC